MSVKYKAKKSLIDVTFLCGVCIFIIGICLMFFVKQETYYLLFGILLTIAGAGLVVLQVFMQMAYSVEITEEYCIIKKGILSKSNNQVSLKNIVSVKCDQSFFGRICNYGDLTFDIVGAAPVFLPHIAKPNDLKAVLEEQMKNAKI